MHGNRCERQSPDIRKWQVTGDFAYALLPDGKSSIERLEDTQCVCIV